MTPLAHAVVGMTGWKFSSRREDIRALFIFMFAASAVDLDFLLYELLGKPQVFVHQLYSHNVFISLAVAAAFFPVLKTARERWALALVALSHLIMDLFVIDTIPPIGFRPFFPVYDRFFSYGFFPYLSRGSWAEIFSRQNGVALMWEVIVFVIPAAYICRKELAYLWRTVVRSRSTD